MSWIQWLRNGSQPATGHGGGGTPHDSRNWEQTTLKVLVAGGNAELLARVERCLANELPATASIIALPFVQAIDRAVQELPHRIVLLLDSHDARGMNTLRELRDLGFEHILAVGPTDQADLILSSIQQGAYQYLGDDQITSELPRLLKRGSQAIPESRHKASKIISIVGTQGGCGASTCATNLALAMSRKYQPIALIDLDLHRGDITALLDLDAHHSIADLCRNVSRMDRAMFEQCFTKHESGVAALAAPRQFDQAGNVTPVGIRKILNMARMEFPFTFIDLPHTCSEAERQTLLQSDTVLVVTVLDFTALRHARRVLGYLQDIGIGEEKVRLVVNRGNRPKEMTSQEARRILQRDVSFWIPEDAKNVNYANNHGTPLVTVAPRAKATKAICEMAYQLNGLASATPHS